MTSCAQCNDALAELQRAKDLLGNLDEVEPPPWLTAKIMSRVREEKEQRASFFKKLFLPFHIKVPLQALSVILVGAIVFQVYRMVEPAKKITQAPSPPSLLMEQEALKEKTSLGAGKSTEALSPLSPQKMPADNVVAKKEETAQLSSGAPAREVQKPGNVPVTVGENAPAIPPVAPEEKTKKEVAGLVNVPRQTAIPEPQVYGSASGDAGKAAFFEKKRAEEKHGAPAPEETLKKQTAFQQLMPHIVVSAPDTAVAKKIAEDIVKQLGGKQIETLTQGATETMIAELPSDKIKELYEKLNYLGKIKTEPQLSDLPEGTLRVQIEISPQ